MSYGSGEALMIERIRAIDGGRFVCHEDASGARPRLEELHGQDSVFIVDLADWPSDDGETGTSVGMWRALLDIRVRYDVTGDRAKHRRRMARDVALLVDAVLADGDYRTGETGVVTVEPPAGPPSLTALPAREGAQERAVILSVRMPMIYRERI